LNSEGFRETLSEERQRGPTEKKMAENNAWGRGSQRGSLQPRAVRAREATPVESVWPAGRGGSVPSREARELYHSQSPWGLEANKEAGRRPELRAEEKALMEEQLKSPELRPLVCLVEARERA
jgi:hypothetical protein